MKKKKVWLIVLIIVVILILTLVIGGYSFMKTYLNQIGRTEPGQVETIPPEDEFFDVDYTEDPAVTPTPTETPTPTDAPEPSDAPAITTPEPTEPPEEPEPENPIDAIIDPDDVEWTFIEKIEDDHLINIMLVGQDKYPGTETTKRQRSDTMILCSINPKTGDVSLISFLRDTYVEIPHGYSDNRLNVPYKYGGFDLLDETLALNFGISVDGNFEVDMAGFEAIIDMIDGVEIELTATEAKYMREISYLDVTEGLNTLNGVEARVYAQIRKIDSDFGRTNRQRTVLLAIFNKIKHLPISDLLDLMYDALPYLTTDLTDGEIISLAYRLLPLVSGMDIETYSVPSKGTYQNVSIRGMAVLLPDREKIRDLLEAEYLPLN